jgi:hypothetical protein
MPTRHDLTGQTFSRLLVLNYVVGFNESYWRCMCVCGRETIVRARSLKSGLSQSCGCLRADRVRASLQTHGLVQSPEYAIWRAAKSRCHNPNSGQYKDYGGRGIRMCDEWRYDFAAFYAHIGQRPAPELTLDRINNDGHYEPGNVQWATRTQQIHNRRKRG